MGSSESSDSQVQIFTSINKTYYYAGQIVQGVAHVNCIADQDANKLTGLKEAASIMRTTKEREIPYSHDIPLGQFKGGIKKGHYSFPFSFMLPTALPASFTASSLTEYFAESKDNLIQYELETWLTEAWLTNNGNTKRNESLNTVFRRVLNIREPPRNQAPNLRGQASCQSNCCSCCCSMGHTALTLEADVNHLQQGRGFQVRGTIDCTNGKADITSFKVLLRQRVRLVGSFSIDSKDIHVRDVDDDVVLYDSQINVSSGRSEQFEASLTLPQKVAEWYTAIGNIISRSYYLVLVAKTSCCYSNPFLQVHSILTSPVIPMPDPKDQVPPPANWDPQVAPLTTAQLRPYVYQPQEVITERNQGGMQVYGQEMGTYPSTEVMHRN